MGRPKFYVRWQHLRFIFLALLGLTPSSVVYASSAILVYPVNPEGVLIGSILGVPPYTVAIYDGSTLKAFSTQYTYSYPIYLTPGDHNIWVKFNGITIGKAVSLQDGETIPLTFVFERTEFPLRRWLDELQLNFNKEIHRSFSLSRDWPSDGWVEQYGGIWNGTIYGNVFTDPQGLSTVGVSASQSFSYKLTGHSYNISMTGSFSADSSQDTWGAMGLTAEVPPPTFSVDIPSGDFENWYVQFRRHGFYPSISFSQTSIEPRLFVHDIPFPGFDIITWVSAGQAYPHIQFSDIDHSIGPSFLGFAPGHNCCPANVSRSASDSGTIDYLKMTSVPYDMTGEGIRIGTFELTLPCRPSQAGLEVGTELKITLSSDAAGCPTASATYSHGWNAVPGAAYYVFNGVNVGNSTHRNGGAVIGALEPGDANCPPRKSLYGQLDTQIPETLKVTAYGPDGAELLKSECARQKIRSCPPPTGIPLSPDMDNDGVGDWLLEGLEGGDDLWCNGTSGEMLVLYEHTTLCAMCLFPKGRNDSDREGGKLIWYNWENPNYDYDKDGIIDAFVLEFDGSEYTIIHKQGVSDLNGDGKVTKVDVKQCQEDRRIEHSPLPKDRVELRSRLKDILRETGGNPPLFVQSATGDEPDECVFEGITGGADFYTLAPCRLVDTRGQAGPYGGPSLASGVVRPFAIAEQCGIPPTAEAISVNVTAINASNMGYLTLFADGAPPLTSTINFVGSLARANNAIIGLSPNGTLSVKPFVAGGGSVDIVVDVIGYFE